MIRRLNRDQEDKKQGGSKATRSRGLKLHEPKIKPQHKLNHLLENAVDGKNVAHHEDTTTGDTSDEIDTTSSMKMIVVSKLCRFLWRNSYTLSIMIVVFLTLHEVYNIAMIPIQYYSSVKDVDMNVKRASRSSQSSLSPLSSAVGTSSTIKPITPYSTTAAIGQQASTTSSINSNSINNPLQYSSITTNAQSGSDNNLIPTKSVNNVYNTTITKSSSATTPTKDTTTTSVVEKNDATSSGLWNYFRNDKTNTITKSPLSPSSNTPQTPIMNINNTTTTIQKPSTTSSTTASTEKKIELPSTFGNYADLIAPLESSDTIFFWKVHLSGATMAERVFGKCYGLTQSSEYFTAMMKGNVSDVLQVVSIQGEKYYNVDLTSIEGIKHAKRIGLFSTRKSKDKKKFPKLDVLYSPLIHEVGESIFNPKYRGRCVTILRHPIERAIGLFFYLQTQQGKHDALFTPSLQTMTLEDYSVSSSVENNWLTRFLVNKRGGKLTMDDVELAKAILERKCILGFMHRLHDSLRRFEHFFGWDKHSKVTQDDDDEKKENSCEMEILRDGDTRHFNPLIQEDSKAYKSLMLHNQFDMILYEYALQLYDIQSKTLFKELYTTD